MKRRASFRTLIPLAFPADPVALAGRRRRERDGEKMKFSIHKVEVRGFGTGTGRRESSVK